MRLRDGSGTLRSRRGAGKAVRTSGRPLQADGKTFRLAAGQRVQTIATTSQLLPRQAPTASVDVAAIDLVKGRGLRESLYLAIGVGSRCAALRTRGEAAVYAVAVGIVGDDEHASLGVRGTGEA